MSIAIGNSFVIICNETSRLCGENKVNNCFGFMQLLKTLTASEKFWLAKHFCKLQWNIGSLRVLGVLQKLRILTATEFILSIQHNEELHLILNDFLEAEYELLANLLISTYYDSCNAVKLGAIVDECISGLFADLLQNQDLNDLSYLSAITESLPDTLLQKFTQKHINIVLNLHSSSIENAFKNFSLWINEGVDHINFTKHLYEKLMKYTVEDSLSYLLQLSLDEGFNQWKLYLILLQTIASKSAIAAAFVRKYLKKRLHQIATMPRRNAMLHLLLTTRAATATTIDIEKNIDAYANWYKQNISDMKFVLKPEEFRNIVTLLEQSIPYEMEKEYLDIHATISISPPIMCSKLVLNYKTKCKKRLSQLKGTLKELPQNESIVIDDD